MSEDWRQRPTLIPSWPDTGEHCLFVDENGTNSLKCIARCSSSGTSVPKDDRYFTVTGCAIQRSEYQNIRSAFHKLKAQFWPNGQCVKLDGSGNQPVIFHSYDIRSCRHPFSRDQIDRTQFLDKLTTLIEHAPFLLFSSTIDKEAHYRQYSSPVDPYELNMKFVVERYAAYYLAKRRESGIIMLESRGAREDRRLLKRLIRMIDYGTEYVEPDKFRWITGIYFSTKLIENIEDEGELVACTGIELTDLCSYPFYHYYREQRFKDRSFPIAEKKLHGYPRYQGKGLKFFP